MTEEVIDDRRAAIEAAFEAEEEKADELTPEANPVVESTVPEVAGTEKPEAKPEVPAVEEKAEEPKPDDAPRFPVDKAPQSWKPAQKAKWEALDPEVRQEVVRREREITRTLGETANARQFANQFQQAVQPFMPRLQAMGAHPMAAVTELLKADYLLSSGPKRQRAELIGKLIKDYDVDIRELDSVLSGQVPPDPVTSTVERLMEQRLAPFQQYLQNQEAARLAATKDAETKLQDTVASMQDNPEYPYFDQVRDTMADLVEIYSKRGAHVELKECYNKAVAMDPKLNELQAAKVVAEKAALLNTKAQRAVKASASVKGAPAIGSSGAPSSTDRRAMIEAAFDAAGGR